MASRKRDDEITKTRKGGHQKGSGAALCGEPPAQACLGGLCDTGSPEREFPPLACRAWFLFLEGYEEEGKILSLQAWPRAET